MSALHHVQLSQSRTTARNSGSTRSLRNHVRTGPTVVRVLCSWVRCNARTRSSSDQQASGAKLSTALQMLKQNVARELRLPEGNPFWMERYYDFNVWSEAKRVEKLRYIHRNPVRRGLVARPEDWKWSSFRHYATGVEGVVEIESEWTARKRERGIPNVSESQSPRPVSPKAGDTRTGHPRDFFPGKSQRSRPVANCATRTGHPREQL